PFTDERIGSARSRAEERRKNFDSSKAAV
ncbi:response regulator, partial [Rhizobium ruizarguesonis]